MYCLSGMYLVGGAGATETVIVDGVVWGGSCEPLSLFGFGLAVGLQRELRKKCNFVSKIRVLLLYEVVLSRLKFWSDLENLNKYLEGIIGNMEI